MSSNRQQITTGLKAILGAGQQHLRAAPTPPDPAEELDVASTMQLETSASVPVAEALVSPPEPVVETPVMRETMSPPELLPPLVTSSRVGTLERPYVRQRDNQATRKVGVVLPVNLADELQIHCVKARMRPNSFIERAIQDALERAR